MADIFSNLIAKLFVADARFEGAEDVSPELLRAIKVPAQNHRRVSLGDALDKHREKIAAYRQEALAQVFPLPKP